MVPFQTGALTGWDQAYVMASLDLVAGTADLARAVVERFPTASLPAFWKGSFERLRAQMDPRAL